MAALLVSNSVFLRSFISKRDKRRGLVKNFMFSLYTITLLLSCGLFDDLDEMCPSGKVGNINTALYAFTCNFDAYLCSKVTKAIFFSSHKENDKSLSLYIYTHP